MEMQKDTGLARKGRFTYSWAAGFVSLNIYPTQSSRCSFAELRQRSGLRARKSERRQEALGKMIAGGGDLKIWKRMGKDLERMEDP